ncbi:MAG: hypothetical protein EON59_01705 [Alphaproteobacteria bacterium]|nr:MAG: hypothetical protein EON59_01705 [Alphaproteobacteria bacterium]
MQIMSRYFFHTAGAEAYHDDDGQELATLEEAKTAAASSIAELLRDGADVFWGTEPWLMRVTDREGRTLFCMEMHGYLAPAAEPYER